MRVTRRISQLVNGLKYNKRKAEWVPLSWWPRLESRESDPTFTKHSQQNKINRRAGKKDGKAEGTHTLGRKSCSDAFRELVSIIYIAFTNKGG